jgi:hypothetical protein
VVLKVRPADALPSRLPTVLTVSRATPSASPVQVDAPGETHVWKVKPKPKTAKGHPFEVEWRPFTVSPQHCRRFEVGSNRRV